MTAMVEQSTNLAQLSVNTIRLLAVDAIENANSGHPGLPLGAAPMAYTLWQEHLRHHPSDPKWPNRDRFVLSAGHGSMLLYALLHLTGYDLPLSELRNFRKWGSRTPGHPETFMTPGVEATTGPLGQGSANAVGMAIAEAHMAAVYNRPGHTVVDHHTYALVSDGDLMEGVSAEAASLAGHLGLGKLIYLYDANEISLDGPISLTFTEDVAARYRAYGWQVLHVADGDQDLASIDQAIRAAKSESQKPSIIIIRTTIGFGAPNKQGTSACHGSALGAAETRLLKQNLGFDPEASFHIPPQALAHFHAGAARGAALAQTWKTNFAAYKKVHPDLATRFEQAISDELPQGWDSDMPTFEPGNKMATREAGSKVLNALAVHLPSLIGGDADLSCSTLTSIRESTAFSHSNPAGRNIQYGVREHAMGAIANGMAYHGGLRPYVSTFFVFSDYMRPSIRLAALNSLPVTFVWTHDSVGLGEDGPTHQPVEQLMSLRAIPNMTVIRPADAVETAGAWHAAQSVVRGPTGLVLSRQKLPVLDRQALGCKTSDVARGAYVLTESPGPLQAIILATGSEVHVALEAFVMLSRDGIAVRVVSMPCWELFAKQDRAYRDGVLPPTVKARLAIEAGVSMGWERWVGDAGAVLGIDAFGASAPGEVIMKELRMTPQHAAERVRQLLAPSV